MNVAWFNERAVSTLASVVVIMKKQGCSYESDQILFDSLRIYSSTFATPSVSVEAMLLNMDRPAREENLEQVKKAMALIKTNPENLVSVLENFATL